MARKLIKVCGMSQADNIREVEALGIDLMGLIFYPKSPRCVRQKPDYLPQRCQRVGVFVNETIDNVVRTAEEYCLDYLQLHGHESPDYCRELRHLQHHLIKAFPIAEASDFAKTAAYEDLCEFYLFDTRTSGFGGSGNRFDWALLHSYRGDTPFLLSGGIGPDLADEVRAIDHPKLAGIDLNSRFEIAPGLKDASKLKAFIHQYRQP